MKYLFITILLCVMTSASAEGQSGQDDIDPSMAPAEDLFECDSIGWFDECKRTNKAYKLNPNQIITTYTREGLRLMFRPQTPPEVIRFMTLMDEQSAIEYYTYHNRFISHLKRTTNTMNDVIKRAGPMDFERQPEDINRDYTRLIDEPKSRVFAFVRSTAQYDVLMPALMGLQRDFPKIRINVIVSDFNVPFVATLKSKYPELSVISLDRKQADRFMPHINNKISLWFEYRKNNQIATNRQIVNAPLVQWEMERVLALANGTLKEFK